MTTALRLMSTGNLLSRASSIRKPPAHSRALVRSSGMVIVDPLDAGVREASFRAVAQVAIMFPLRIRYNARVGKLWFTELE